MKLIKLFIIFLIFVSLTSAAAYINEEASYSSGETYSYNAPINYNINNTYSSSDFVDATCPDYNFNRNFAQGERSADVYVIQTILNQDERTRVAELGPGSPGNETMFFGKATREALKRFQALFIEYVNVADGKFTTKTRNVMNAVCHGPYFTGESNCGVFSINEDIQTGCGGGVVVEIEEEKKSEPITVSLYGPEVISCSDGMVKVLLVADRPIKTPRLNGLILYNATAQNIRKISPNSFLMYIFPSPDTRGYLSVQMEADTLEDVLGNSNAFASNELIIEVDGLCTSTSTTTSNSSVGSGSLSFPDLDSLLSQAGLPPLGTSAYNGICPAGYSVVPQSFADTVGAQGTIRGSDGTLCKLDPTYNYGGSGGSGSSQQGDKKKPDLSKLMDMLSKLMGGGGGSPSLKDGGGIGGPSGTCVCDDTTTPKGQFPNKPTAFLTSFGGGAANGAYLSENNEGAGKWTGKVISHGGICGQAKQKVGNQTICVNPQADSAGIPLMGTIPPPPIFRWEGI